MKDYSEYNEYNIEDLEMDDEELSEDDFSDPSEYEELTGKIWDE